jgi:hypothetical protein
VIAKVEWHPGELYPRVGFIVTNLSRPAERVVAFYNIKRREECVQMPARMTRSALQSPFELAEVRAVVRATRLSCQNARKAQKFTPVRGSSGESRLKLISGVSKWIR